VIYRWLFRIELAMEARPLTSSSGSRGPTPSAPNVNLRNEHTVLPGAVLATSITTKSSPKTAQIPLEELTYIPQILIYVPTRYGP